MTEYAYDAGGNKLSETITDTVTGAARTTRYGYNAQGLLISINGPRLNVVDVTRYAYDAQGDLTRITNALGQVTQITAHDAHGNPLNIVDPNGVVTRLTYDPRQRLTSSTTAGETTGFEYDGVGNLIKLTLPDGSFFSYIYNAAHRLTQVRDQLGNRVVYTLDAMGNRTKERVLGPAGALLRTRVSVFNRLNRLVREIGGQNQATDYEYDDNGNLITLTDALDHVTRNVYDPLNRLAQVTDPADGVTRYGYDSNDNLAEVTDPRGLTTAYGYDAFGDLTQLDSPDTGLTAYSYDLAGNLASEEDARGQIQNYTYDALNRLTSMTNPARGFVYDQGVNGIGRLTRMTDPAGTTQWTYNAKGGVAQKTQITGAVALSVRYAYNAKGQLSAITYPSGKVVRYGYDQLGRVASIAVDGAALVTGIQYEPFGPVSGWSWGNGTLHRRGFDLDGRVISQDLGPVTRALAYDAAGRISSMSHNDLALQDRTFSYDPLDRLTGFTARVANQTYRYDADGNRTSLTSGTETQNYIYPPTSNRLSEIVAPTSTTFAYDAAGNLTGEGDRNYTYDGSRRLTSVAVGASATSYQYNALGQRLVKSGADGATRFFYDESGHLVGEYDGAGALVREIVYLGDTPVALLQPTVARYIHADHLDTPRLITSTANTFLWRWDSNPFGTTPPTDDFDGNGVKFIYNQRFPGQYYDKETGLHYNYFRDYDPRIGRYIESNPLGWRVVKIPIFTLLLTLYSFLIRKV